MTDKRKFSKNGVQHLYQISADKSMIFCSIYDMILLFTLISVKARQYNIRITQLCIMYNHFHIQAVISNQQDMENFMYAVTWAFSIIYNQHYGLSGQLFKHSYGNAPKKTEKKIKTNLIYIANNPVEKQAVKSAWDYRWNFLRYAPKIESSTGKLEYTISSRHPYSEEYDHLEASKDMQYLVSKIKTRYSKGEIISYDLFETQRFTNLSEKEKKQLIDIIIVTYNNIDYRPVLNKYGSIEQYCKILCEVEGSEYDMGDDSEPEDYRHYPQMIAIAAEEGYDMRKKRYASGEMIPLPIANKIKNRCKTEVGATELEIRKLFKL